MKRFQLLFFFAASVCIITCSSCLQKNEKPVVLVDLPEQVNKEAAELIRKQLKDYDSTRIFVVDRDSLWASKLTSEFYVERKFNPAWSDEGKLTLPGDSLFNLIKNAADYGLIANEYHFNKIDSLLKTKKDTSSKKFDAVKISNADILLTDAFFAFAVHVSRGRLNTDSLVREWKGPKLNANAVSILNNAIKNNTIHTAIDSLEPRNKEYNALKSALKKFRTRFRYTDWDSLASRESDSLTFKDRLRKRLSASYNYFEDEEGTDSIKLIKAIKRFQHMHNLEEDGKLGKLTFSALQRTKKDYIRQIEVNIERWRLYDYPPEKQFVWVNIPKFELRVIEKDTLVMSSHVIVGKPDHKTPLLKSTIRYMLIYPYWNVPFSIAVKEILPILKRDTSYLRRKNFDVLDGYGNIVKTHINWKKYSKTYFPYRIRQREGDDNSLGILKFNFDNKYGVYLHDTDAHRLFKREMRALSHGCVRLEKFIDLAKFLIRDDSVKYPLNHFKMDLLKEEQKYVYLRHPVPIYINYFTAEVDEDNHLFLFIDVYKRDEKMLKALYKKGF